MANQPKTTTLGGTLNDHRQASREETREPPETTMKKDATENLPSVIPIQTFHPNTQNENVNYI